MISGIWTSVIQRLRPSEESLDETLGAIHLFEGLSRSERNDVERIVHFRTYQSGEAIFHQDNPGVAMYIVLEGKVNIVQRDEKGGDDRVLASILEGEFFGELGLLDESPRSASAVASRPTNIVAISRPDLLELMQRNTALGVKVLIPLSQLIVTRLRFTNERLSEITNSLEESEALNQGRRREDAEERAE